MPITLSIQKFQDPLANIFRVFGNVAGAFAPSIETGIHMVANKIDGTVCGIEKPLAERWSNAVLLQAEMEGTPRKAVEETLAGYKHASQIHNEMFEEAANKQARGLSRLKAQEQVIRLRERREEFFGFLRS